ERVERAPPRRGLGLATVVALREHGDAQGHVDQARGVLGALDVARGPVEVAGGAAQHQVPPSSTQVSLVPPPCDEFATSEPSRSATRVRPPGTTWMRWPLRMYGRRSMWRGARPLSTKVGQVDSDSVGCAM